MLYYSITVLSIAFCNIHIQQSQPAQCERKLHNHSKEIGNHYALSPKVRIQAIILYSQKSIVVMVQNIERFKILWASLGRANSRSPEYFDEYCTRSKRFSQTLLLITTILCDMFCKMFLVCIVQLLESRLNFLTFQAGFRYCQLQFFY